MTPTHGGYIYFVGVIGMIINVLARRKKLLPLFAILALMPGFFTQALANRNYITTEQSTPFYTKNVASLGYGLYSFDFDNWAGTKGPLMAKYEHRFNSHLGLGMNLAAGRKMSTVLGGSAKKTTFFSALVRANYYFEINSQIESYFGVGVGVRNTLPFHKPSSTSLDGGKDGLVMPNNSLGLEATVGIRFHVLPNLSCYTEAGFSKGLIQFGACYHW